MSKKCLSFLIVGTIFTVFSISDLIFELFGVSAFLFGKRIFPVLLGAFIIISVLSFTAFVFSFLGERGEALGKRTVIAARTVSVILALTISLISFFVIALTNERTLYKDVSDDGRHEITVETDSLFGGWSITMYKRYTPFLKTEMTQFYVSDMAQEDGEIKVVWYDDGCDISYEYYSDYVQTAQGETFTQRLYFEDKTG